jgi:hypothetical protein
MKYSLGFGAKREVDQPSRHEELDMITGQNRTESRTSHSKFADVTGVVARLQQQSDLDSSLRQPEGQQSGEARKTPVGANEKLQEEKQCGASWYT